MDNSEKDSDSSNPGYPMLDTTNSDIQQDVTTVLINNPDGNVLIY